MNSEIYRENNRELTEQLSNPELNSRNKMDITGLSSPGPQTLYQVCEMTVDWLSKFEH